MIANGGPVPQDHWHVALSQAKAGGAEAEAGFFRRLQAETDDGTVAAFLVEVLEGLQADDGALIPMTAANELARRNCTEVLPRLLAARRRLPPMPGLRDYRGTVDDAIAQLEATAAGRCHCATLALRNMGPQGQPGLTIHDEQVDRNAYSCLMTVRCQACGRTWRVTQDDSYHYPIFAWEAVAKGDGLH
jgi:hypothetical protein